MDTKTKKFGKYIRYCIGQIQDSVPYNFVNVYLLMFLVDVAGLNASLAGTIIFITVLWDAVTDPAIGYFSDNLKSKYGRRRPFMICSIMPLFAVIVILFAPLDLPDSAKFPFYLIMGLLFWLTFTGYSITYNSFGAEIVQDTNERNNLKAIGGFFMYFATWLATAVPQFIQSFVEDYNMSDQMVWFISAAGTGALAAIAGIVCWRLTRGMEKIDPVPIEKEKIPFGTVVKSLFTDYKKLLGVKVVREMTIVATAFNMFFAVKVTGFIYLQTCNLGLSAAMIGVFFTISSFLSYAVIPILNVLANKFSKKKTFIITWGCMIVFGLVFFIVQINSFAVLVIYQIFFSLANVTYWTTGTSLFFDCIDVAEFKLGKNMGGGVMGVSSFFAKFGYAIGAWFAGVWLDFVGYDAALEVQTEHTLWGINTMLTLIPIAILFVGLIFMLKFPLDKVKHQKLIKELEKKNNGEEYTTEGFEDAIK